MSWRVHVVPSDASADLDGDGSLAFLFQTGPLWKEKIVKYEGDQHSRSMSFYGARE